MINDTTPKNLGETAKGRKLWHRITQAVNEQLCDETGEVTDIIPRVSACLSHGQVKPVAIKLVTDNIEHLAFTKPDPDVPDSVSAFIRPGAKAFFNQEILPLLQG